MAKKKADDPELEAVPEAAGDPNHQEYPKWVTPDGGPPTLVQDAEHEARVLAGPQP